MRWFKHLAPLLLLGAIGVGLWQSGLLGELSWGSLARHQATLLGAVGANPLLAGAIYVVTYALLVALSVPEGAVVTAAGGLLFGTLVGGALAVVGATIGAVILFLVARTAFAEVMARRARGLIERIRPRLQRDGFQLPAGAPAGSGGAVLAGKPGRGAVRHAAIPLRHGHCAGHHSGHLRVRLDR